MQRELELVLVQELHSWVARDKGLHSQAEGLSLAQTHLKGVRKQLSKGIHEG